MDSNRAYNKRLENINMRGNKAQRRRKYREIIKDMGEREISLADIANGLGDKEKGFLEMVNEKEMTLDEILVLQQYAQAIKYGDTKAATFLRDTVGEAPKQQVEVSDEGSGLSKMSYEELLELKEALKH